MNARVWLAIPFLVVIFILVNVYIGWNGYVLLASFFPSASPLVYGIIFGIIASSFIVGRLSLLGPVGRLLKVIGSYYVFILEYALLTLPIVNLLAWGFGRMLGYSSEHIQVIGLILLGLIVILIARGTWNAWSPVVNTYEIDIHKQVENEHELSIVMGSDFHLGNIVGKRHLHKFVEYTQASRPDIVLLVGDIIDDSIEPFMRNDMGEVLRQIKSRLGTYAVLGNHEYYGGHRERFVVEMAKLHIPVLQDEVITIEEKLHIVGRKDRTAENIEGGRQSIADLLQDVDKERPVLMMDHQPNDYEAAANEGVDLLVSGHTHLGQFFPNQYFTRRIFELDWGYSLINGTMHAIVSSGFGSWGPPIRLGSRSEIVKIHVRFHTE